MTDPISNYYSLRRATQRDIGSMTGLLGILFAIEADFSADESAQRRGLELMLSENNNRCIMVAESEQRVIGMCTAQILVSTAEGGIAALIEDLVLAEGWRGRGLGKELLSAVEDWAIARGATRLQLLADRNNTSALAFYQKVNWRRTDLICLRKGELV